MSRARSRQPLCCLPRGEALSGFCRRSGCGQLCCHCCPGVLCFCLCALPLIHFRVQRLGDAIQLLIIHAGKCTAHVVEEPSHRVEGRAGSAPRGRFCWVGTNAIPAWQDLALCFCFDLALAPWELPSPVGMSGG